MISALAKLEAEKREELKQRIGAIINQRHSIDTTPWDIAEKILQEIEK